LTRTMIGYVSASACPALLFFFYSSSGPSSPANTRLLFLHYLQFFSSYTTLILSTNYVTKRQSLKLLGEILLDRANFNVMTRYIANEANLKMMMNLLRDKSKNIQFEAFHVFKVSASSFSPSSPYSRSFKLGTGA
jgi:hypothetical protein